MNEHEKIEYDWRLSPDDIKHENRMLAYLMGETYVHDTDDLCGENAFRAVRILIDYAEDFDARRQADEEFDQRLLGIEATLERTIPKTQQPKLVEETGPYSELSPTGTHDPLALMQYYYEGSWGGGTPGNPQIIPHSS